LPHGVLFVNHGGLDAGILIAQCGVILNREASCAPNRFGGGATVKDLPQLRDYSSKAAHVQPDLESAIPRDLAPGNYTAIVSGVNSTTGVAVS